VGYLLQDGTERQLQRCCLGKAHITSTVADRLLHLPNIHSLTHALLLSWKVQGAFTRSAGCISACSWCIVSPYSPEETDCTSPLAGSASQPHADTSQPPTLRDDRSRTCAAQALVSLLCSVRRPWCMTLSWLGLARCSRPGRPPTP
jgi:hypothetical protein